MTDTIATRFLARWGAIHDLQQAKQLLEWDQQVMMPPRGLEQRGSEVAALAEVAHERLIAPALGEDLQALEQSPSLDPDLRADLREARRQYDRAVKVPTVLVAEHARVCALAQAAWEHARTADNFGQFRPHLERVLELTRQIAACIDPARPYDALLDGFESEMKAETVERVFGELRPKIVALLDRVRGAPRQVDDALLRRRFPAAAQQALCRRVLADMGFDFQAGRLDVSAHPFTSGTLADVRLTTRYDEQYLGDALWGALHEGGHGLYEQGLDPARVRRPAGGPCSLGMHESQSRFWENQVGRSRAFCTRYHPVLLETFPGVLDGTDADALFRALNVVRPSLIRVGADELTYNLHILLRFQLERALLSGELAVGDLPAAWREQMRALLGVVPPDDREGALQDIHWSVGAIGYFPTYTLGNLYAAQLRQALARARPDFEDGIARGELAPIREWLRREVHAPGARYPAHELCRRVTGGPLSAAPFLEYLADKYAVVYGI